MSSEQFQDSPQTSFSRKCSLDFDYFLANSSSNNTNANSNTISKFQLQQQINQDYKQKNEDYFEEYQFQPESQTVDQFQSNAAPNSNQEGSNNFVPNCQQPNQIDEDFYNFDFPLFQGNESSSLQQQQQQQQQKQQQNQQQESCSNYNSNAPQSFSNQQEQNCGQLEESKNLSNSKIIKIADEFNVSELIDHQLFQSTNPSQNISNDLSNNNNQANGICQYLSSNYTDFSNNSNYNNSNQFVQQQQQLDQQPQQFQQVQQSQYVFAQQQQQPEQSKQQQQQFQLQNQQQYFQQQNQQQQEQFPNILSSDQFLSFSESQNAIHEPSMTYEEYDRLEQQQKSGKDNKLALSENFGEKENQKDSRDNEKKSASHNSNSNNNNPFLIKNKRISKNAQAISKNYEKNICGNLTKRAIRAFVNKDYKQKVMEFSDNDEELYNDSTDYFLRNIQKISGFRLLKEFLNPVELEDEFDNTNDCKRVFKNFLEWFLKERSVRYILKGEMSDKLSYIKYKNEVMLPYLRQMQNWTSNKSVKAKKKIINAQN